MNIDSQLLREVETSVVRAGQLLKVLFKKRLLEQTMAEENETSADSLSEQLLINDLLTIIPSASVYAEESGKKEGMDRSSYCWVIDPLDGTTNFLARVPHFCVSVALTHDDIPVVGVVYDPLRDELFSGYEGGGAYLNGTRLDVKLSQGHGAIVGVSSLYDSYKNLLPSMRKRGKSIRFRCLGAIALDLAYVASMRFSGVFIQQARWWDIASGILLVKEAGGITSDFWGREPRKSIHPCVASSDVAMYSALVSSLVKK